MRSDDDWLKKEILRVYDGNHQVYGVRKVWRQLLREGIRVARCTVARLMAVMGLAGVLRGKKVRTTVSRKAVAAGDRVNRQFVAERSDQLWVADFTYGVPGVQGRAWMLKWNRESVWNIEPVTHDEKPNKSHRV